MAYIGELPRYICINIVKAGSEELFEGFVRDEIMPAISATRPELADRVATLRPDGANEDGSWSYAFAFYGASTLAEWDLEGPLTEALGKEAADAKIALFESFLERQDIVGFAGTV